MILDSGICRILAREGVEEPGLMHALEDAEVRFESCYGELGFESSPAYPTRDRLERRTDARVRILQCRAIREDDAAILISFSEGGERRFRITRAWHGADEESGEAITDLSLEEVCR